MEVDRQTFARLVGEAMRRGEARGHLMGHCSIYADRPDLCRGYPEQADDWLRAAGCTALEGACQPWVCLSMCCCALPREGGEPEGRVMVEGGEGCRWLRWVWPRQSSMEGESHDEAKGAGG